MRKEKMHFSYMSTSPRREIYRKFSGGYNPRRAVFGAKFFAALAIVKV